MQLFSNYQGHETALSVDLNGTASLISSMSNSVQSALFTLEHLMQDFATTAPQRLIRATIHAHALPEDSQVVCRLVVWEGVETFVSSAEALADADQRVTWLNLVLGALDTKKSPARDDLSPSRWSNLRLSLPAFDVYRGGRTIVTIERDTWMATLTRSKCMGSISLAVPEEAHEFDAGSLLARMSPLLMLVAE